jgi:hypothetical protein
VSERAKPRLETARAASAHQRAWFGELQARVRAGEAYALVNADTPHELFRAMGIPYVVNQWWASLCAAKQQGPAYLAALRERGYPDDSEAYSALTLGASFADPESTPWGGLPAPKLVVADLTGDVNGKLAEAWSRAHGSEVFLFERAVDNALPERFWERLAHEWEAVIGSARLDLMVEELRQLIELLERTTGKRFEMDALAEVMTLANEHAEWNRRARDRLAAAEPAPLDIVDSIPAVMLPQWHRGSRYGRDAARAFHDEAVALADAGAAVCPEERVRLMWIGRGLWFDLGFYQHFQERYGAVFVWSMYLAIAADGYARYGDDPLRCLAARFACFGDFLGMPGWANEWYLAEARRHRVDGVVHLLARDARCPYFVTRTLEHAGIPVLEIDADNADARSWDDAAIRARLEDFIATRVAPVAEQRRQGR